MTENLKELVLYVAQHLVSKPDEVSVTEVEKDNALVYELRVAQEDMGKVIGRGGRIAKDIRTVVRSSAREGQRVSVEIIDR